MQQERKFDTNQLIGFILLFLLTIGFFYYNEKFAPKPEPEQTDQTVSVDSANLVVPEADSVQEQSIAETQVAAKNYTLENENLLVKISSQGGQLKFLELKGYTAFDSNADDHKRPLDLINNNSEFSFGLKTANGRVYNTKSLTFRPIKQSDKSVVLQANLNPGTLTYTYSLDQHYDLKFNAKLNGVGLTSAPEVTWNFKAFSLEKGRQQEDIYTDTHMRYKDDGDDTYYKSDWDKDADEPLDWVGFKQQFFASIIYNANGFYEAKGNAAKIESDSTFIKDFSFAAKLGEKNQLKEEFTFSFVPLDYELLSSEAYESKDYSNIIPFGIWGGGGLIGFINKHFFLNVFKWLAQLGLAYGWVIFLLTIVVKLVTSPIMYKQFKQGAMMRVIRPEMDAINEQYKDKDAMQKQQAIWGLYKKAGVNPLAGCLPALLQIPIFYSLFRFFPNVIDLRGKPFLWAEDLTAYDSLINLGVEIPFLGSHISVFALLYIVVMIIYFKVSGSLSNFQTPQQEGMPDMSFMKYMMYIMPLFFFVFLNSYASGLSWYYLVSNTINIGLILFIKNVMIDEDKIHAKIQENKKKPVKTNRFQRRMQEMMEKAQEQQRKQPKGSGKKK